MEEGDGEPTNQYQARENLVGKSCGKLLREIVAEKSCGKILQEILVGNGGGEKANLRKAVIGGNLAFGIG